MVNHWHIVFVRKEDAQSTKTIQDGGIPHFREISLTSDSKLGCAIKTLFRHFDVTDARMNLRIVLSPWHLQPATWCDNNMFTHLLLIFSIPASLDWKNPSYHLYSLILETPMFSKDMWYHLTKTQADVCIPRKSICQYHFAFLHQFLLKE